MPRSNSAASNRPEKKIGPFTGGISVAVRLNEIQTDDGPRLTHSIQIAPRRYKNGDGDWVDSASGTA